MKQVKLTESEIKLLTKSLEYRQEQLKRDRNSFKHPEIQKAFSDEIAEIGKLKLKF